MPFTKKTLQDCLQGIADRHESNGVIPSSSAITSFWTRVLNRGVAYCADRLRLTKSTSLTTVSGTIALPDDFIIATDVFTASEEPLVRVDPDNLVAHTNGTFWITGNQTDGFFLNTTEDATYTVKYSFKPVEMSATSDKCIIPDIEAVVAYAYGLIRRTESDPFEDAETAIRECDTRLAEIQSQSSINSNSINFDFDA